MGEELEAEGKSVSLVNEGRAVSGASGRQTYTFESIVTGVLEVEGIHVVNLRHVFLPLFELFLVG